MTRERPRRAWSRARVVGVLALGLVAAGGLAFVAKQNTAPPATSAERAERPALMLLTTLPLIFGDAFGLEIAGSPALRALEKRYRVVPISVTDPAELKQARLLLMAHPLAQPPWPAAARRPVHPGSVARGTEPPNIFCDTTLQEMTRAG